MNLKTNKHIVLSLIAAILCMLAIFILSAQPATESDSNSKEVLTHVLDTTVKLGGAEMTEQQKTELVDKINSVAREVMHSVVYFSLGIFVQITVLGIFKEKLLSVFITFTFCVTYGFSDEIHQLFIAGRTFQMIDLVMDTMGVSVAIALVLLTYVVRNRKKINKGISH